MAMAEVSRFFVSKRKTRSLSPESGSREENTAKRRRLTYSFSGYCPSADTEERPGSRDPLLKILDFTYLSCQDHIQKHFNKVARALMEDYRLSVMADTKRIDYEIMELEFYLYRPEGHEDPFTHRAEEQERAGRWYFHRAPRRSEKAPKETKGTSSGYRGGTRKGLDLTIGIPDHLSEKFREQCTRACNSSVGEAVQVPPLRGGILLRTIRRLSDEKVISGPSLLVDEILRASGAKTIGELVTTKWNGDIRAFPAAVHQEHADTASSDPSKAILGSGSMKASLRLARTERIPGSPELRIFRSPRIGLDLSNPDIPKKNSHSHPRVQFISKPYRYFVHPHLLTANGRGQTFLGVYRGCTDSGRLKSDDDDAILGEVMRLTGLKAQTAMNYLVEFKRGREKGELRSFLGTAGKGASASPTTFLRLMGVLDSLVS